MKLVIDKKYPRDFVYDYLPGYINRLLMNNFDYGRAHAINSELKINLLNIFKQSINTLTIHETGDSYIMSINKGIRVKNKSLDEVVNYITYGSRSFKGYPLLLNIFTTIDNNLYIIYQR